MKLLYTLLALFIAVAFADDKTTKSSSSSLSSSSSSKKSSSVSKTVVWATGTDSQGNLATTKSYYTQTFSIYYSSATGTVSSGSVGLGSLSGKVGQIREYTSSTISNNAPSLRLSSPGKNAFFKEITMDTTALIATLPLFVLGTFLL